MKCMYSNRYSPPQGQAFGEPQEYEGRAANVNKELGYDMSDDIIGPLQALRNSQFRVSAYFLSACMHLSVITTVSFPDQDYPH